MVIRRHIINPITELAEKGKLSGILLILATIASLTIANSALGNAYLSLWNTEMGFSFLNKSLLHWINDGLMTIFFLLVGLEIKRELISGELSEIKKAVLPVIAALGGLITPAIIYIALNTGNEAALQGWAIPTATDIAFSLGILSLLGNRVPFILKIFLTALAIIDDLGAIIIIAVFYTSNIQLSMLLYAVIVLIVLIFFNRLRIKKLYFYIIPGILLWYFILKSGIHPTLAGVALAFTIPADLAEGIEHRLSSPVNYFILPVFALANTAMILSLEQISEIFSPVYLGIIAALFIGKPLGIVISVFLAVKFRLAALPAGMNWNNILGLGLTAGIGFTMSIFIASLSFDDEIMLTLAKLGILVGSLLSALAGYFLLFFSYKHNQSKRVL